MLETDWMDMLRQKHPHGRFLFLAEGVMMYFNEEQVKSVIQNLAQRFPGCEIYFDFASKWAARNSDKHESGKTDKSPFPFRTKRSAHNRAMVPQAQTDRTILFHQRREKTLGTTRLDHVVNPGATQVFWNRRL